MDAQEQITAYINSQPQAKRADMQALHGLMVKVLPTGKLWFDDGKNEDGKVVTNPTAGYGNYTIKYADGKTKDFFQTGFSGNTSGISVYVMGIKDRNYLPQTFGKEIGKANVTGYCVKFKSLKDINLNVLEEAIRYGVNATNEN